MGRKKLNKTPEELREQKRIRDQRYYERHTNKINANKMAKYYQSKVKRENEKKGMV
jgi:REP element-mobilizing transposase RayT